MEVEKGKKKGRILEHKKGRTLVRTSQPVKILPVHVFEWYRDCGRNIQPSPNNGSSGDCVFKIVKILY